MTFLEALRIAVKGGYPCAIRCEEMKDYPSWLTQMRARFVFDSEDEYMVMVTPLVGGPASWAASTEMPLSATDFLGEWVPCPVPEEAPTQLSLLGETE